MGCFHMMQLQGKAESTSHKQKERNLCLHINRVEDNALITARMHTVHKEIHGNMVNTNKTTLQNGIIKKKNMYFQFNVNIKWCY